MITVPVNVLAFDGQWIQNNFQLQENATLLQLRDLLQSEQNQENPCWQVELLLWNQTNNSMEPIDLQTPLSQLLQGSICACKSLILPVIICTRTKTIKRSLKIGWVDRVQDMKDLANYLYTLLDPEEQQLFYQLFQHPPVCIEILDKGTKYITQLAEMSGQHYAQLKLGISPELLIYPSFTLPVMVLQAIMQVPVKLTDTWSKVFLQMSSDLSDDFKRVSSQGCFYNHATNSWIADDDHIYNICQQGAINLSLHPIVSALVITLANGQLAQFVAKLPADIAITDLMTDLVQQAERVVNFSTSDGRSPQISCIYPFSFSENLSQGNLGIPVNQTLLDAGIEEGWAILLLTENNTIPGIIRPYIHLDPQSLKPSAEMVGRLDSAKSEQQLPSIPEPVPSVATQITTEMGSGEGVQGNQ